MAGEYHSADFEWEELVESGEAAVARQWQERQLCVLEQQQQQGRQPTTGGAAATEGKHSTAGMTGSSDVLDQAATGGSAEEEEESWERFHSQHSQARFFKEKR